MCCNGNVPMSRHLRLVPFSVSNVNMVHLWLLAPRSTSHPTQVPSGPSKLTYSAAPWCYTHHFSLDVLSNVVRNCGMEHLIAPQEHFS